MIRIAAILVGILFIPLAGCIAPHELAKNDLISAHLGRAIWKPCILNLKLGTVECDCDEPRFVMVFDAKTGTTVLNCARKSAR